MKRSLIKAILILVAFQTHPDSAAGETEISRTTPLAGNIWSVEAEAFVTVPEMIEAIRSTRFLLLGERHGRDAHQHREAFLIGALAESGRYPVIALEMLSHAQTTTVATYRQSAPEYAPGLGIALNWAESGWPAWQYYQPIFDMGFATKAEIVGADLTDQEQDAVLAATAPSPLSQSFTHYATQMKKAHCNLIEDARAQDLARLQMARDQEMASQLKQKSDPEHGIVLIVGASHVRKSTGIPSYLPSDQTTVILLRETEADVTQFMTPFQEIVPGNLSDYDFIWFTPKIAETSFCDRIGANKSEKR